MTPKWSDVNPLSLIGRESVWRRTRRVRRGCAFIRLRPIIPSLLPARSGLSLIGMFSEIIELRGHIVDSLIPPKVLDQILAGGSSFEIEKVRIGRQRTDPSYARIIVSAA